MNLCTIFHQNIDGNLSLTLPRTKPRNRMHIQATNASKDHQWAVWDFSKHDKILCAFGTISSDSQSGYFYIAGNGDNDLVLTNEGRIPTQADAEKEDNRFFYYYNHVQHRGNVLQHVASRRFVAMKKNRSGRAISQLYLTENAEQACTWEFGSG